MTCSRRSALLCGVAFAALGRDGFAAESSVAPDLTKIPLRIRVCGAMSDAAKAFVDVELSEVARIYRAHRLGFVEVAAPAGLGEAPLDVISRDDRDAFARFLVRGAIDVFVVRKLDDVDEPGRSRMGVAWRCLADLEKRYVLVASYARPSVLAHELGHFLGNPHSAIRNNVMSYDHDEGIPSTMNAAQAARVRAAAQKGFADGSLVVHPR